MKHDAAGLSLLEATRLALESIRANPLRSFLTLSGIIIGVAAIISTAAIINGLNSYVAEKLSNLGNGVIVLQRVGIVPDRDDRLEAIRRNPRLRPDDARAIEERARSVDTVGVEVHATADVKCGDLEVRDTDIGGITTSILEIEPYEVAQGRILTQAEEDSAAAVAFVGNDIVDNLFPMSDPIGRRIRVRGATLEVIGVAAKKGSFLGFSMDNFVKIPFSLHRKLWGTTRSVNISVKAIDADRMETTTDEVRAVMRARHHLAPKDDDDFGILTPEGINSLWRSLTATLFSVAMFVVGISLVVGGIVIMNIMLVSVIERTREIGIRKAVGARQADIVKQFLVEAVVLCLVGGGIGIAIAYSVTWLLASQTPLPARFPTWAPPVAFVICTAIGLFFGIHPARKAARLDPIEALRSE